MKGQKQDKVCRKVIGLLPLYIDKELDSKKMDMVRQHLSICDACKKEYEFMAAVIHTAKSMEAAPVSRAFEARLHQRLTAAAAELETQEAAGLLVRLRKRLNGMAGAIGQWPAWTRDWRTYGTAAVGVFVVAVAVIAFNHTPSTLPDSSDSMLGAPATVSAQPSNKIYDDAASAEKSALPEVTQAVGQDAAASNQPDVPMDGQNTDIAGQAPERQNGAALPQVSPTEAPNVMPERTDLEETADLPNGYSASVQAPPAPSTYDAASESRSIPDPVPAPESETDRKSYEASTGSSAPDSNMLQGGAPTSAPGGGAVSGSSAAGGGGGGGGASMPNSVYMPAPAEFSLLDDASSKIKYVAIVLFREENAQAAKAYLDANYSQIGGLYVVDTDAYAAALSELSGMDGFVSQSESQTDMTAQYQQYVQEARTADSESRRQELYRSMEQLNNTVSVRYIQLEIQ